ncbi:MAG: hypothetical protein LBE49_00745 [Deltaproteobacteria bacterium]|jgi:hypothetical protein|nr:hypothetical protein [Deltaproteobacteria bacterium]
MKKTIVAIFAFAAFAASSLIASGPASADYQYQSSSYVSGPQGGYLTSVHYSSRGPVVSRHNGHGHKDRRYVLCRDNPNWRKIPACKRQHQRPRSHRRR